MFDKLYNMCTVFHQNTPKKIDDSCIFTFLSIKMLSTMRTTLAFD